MLEFPLLACLIGGQKKGYSETSRGEKYFVRLHVITVAGDWWIWWKQMYAGFKKSVERNEEIKNHLF